MKYIWIVKDSSEVFVGRYRLERETKHAYFIHMRGKICVVKKVVHNRTYFPHPAAAIRCANEIRQRKIKEHEAQIVALRKTIDARIIVEVPDDDLSPLVETVFEI